MEQIKELTKRLIANSFKELMLQTSFEKITIKMITDHASVIRPTFYNHFHDKYELVEWILRTDVLDVVAEKIKDGQTEDAVTYLFSGFYEDVDYYRKAFEIKGQNGFMETLSSILTEMFKNGFSEKKAQDNQSVLSEELIGRYYASGLISVLKFGIHDGECTSLEEILDAYNFMTRHTIYELFN